MKILSIAIFALTLVGCSENSPSQRLPAHRLKKEYDKRSAKRYIEQIFISLRGSTNAVGIAPDIKEEIPIIGPISTLAVYFPRSDWGPEYLYIENTNENWVVAIFDPNKDLAEMPAPLEKVTEYVGLHKYE